MKHKVFEADVRSSGGAGEHLVHTVGVGSAVIQLDQPLAVRKGQRVIVTMTVGEPFRRVRVEIDDRKDAEPTPADCRLAAASMKTFAAMQAFIQSVAALPADTRAQLFAAAKALDDADAPVVVEGEAAERFGAAAHGNCAELSPSWERRP